MNNRYTIPKSTTSKSVDKGLQAYMQRVYNVMAFGLVITGFVAWITYQTPQLFQAVNGTWLGLIVALAPLGIIFFGLTPHKVSRMSMGAVMGLYTILTALMGLSLSYIFVAYSAESIARVFFITAGMFSATSIYGYTTKKDLSGMGSLMFMGLIGIIIASLVNLFLQSSMLHFITSVIGVVVFTGLTAWDTQRIKDMYRMAGGTELTKMAVMGSLSLYINFINLYIMLLQILGNRE